MRSRAIIKSEIEICMRDYRAPRCDAPLSASAVKIYGRAARSDFRDLIKADPGITALWAPFGRALKIIADVKTVTN